jgi:hypothetical protein
VEEYFSLVFHNDSGENFFFSFSLINVEISRIFNERGSSIYWLYIYNRLHYSSKQQKNEFTYKNTFNIKNRFTLAASHCLFPVHMSSTLKYTFLSFLSTCQAL